MKIRTGRFRQEKSLVDTYFLLTTLTPLIWFYKQSGELIASESEEGKIKEEFCSQQIKL